MSVLVDWITSLSLFGLFISVYISSYFLIPITSSLSFKVDDGWCGQEPLSRGFGNHCFGDYYYNSQYFENESPYFTPGGIFQNAYPPIAMFIFKTFFSIAGLTSNGQFALFLYLFALLVPTFLLIFMKYRVMLSIRLSLLILLSLPVISALDRGNIVLLTIPSLYFFAHKYLLGLERAWLYLLPAILIKPQFALILLVYVNKKQFRTFLKSIFVSTLSLFLSFVLFPSTIFQNIQNWIAALLAFQDYNQEASHYPINLSAVNLFYLPIKVFRSFVEQQVVDVSISGFARQSTVLALLAICLFVFLRVSSNEPRIDKLLIAFLLPILLPSSSFSYYTVILIPLFLLYIEKPRLFTEVFASRIQRCTSIGLSLLCFFPIVIPLELLTSFGSEGTEITVSWYLIGFMIFLNFVILVLNNIRNQFSEKRKTFQSETNEQS
jgi:hypothetical protein